MTVLDQITAAIEAQQRPPSPVLKCASDAVLGKMRDAGVEVLGLLFYGSRLRAADDCSKMVDLYVLIDRLDDMHRTRIRRTASHLFPPDVFMLKTSGPHGEEVAIKYAVITLSAFQRLAQSPLGTSIWGRFTQATQLIAPRSDAIRREIISTLALCVSKFAKEVEGLHPDTAPVEVFFAEGLAQSYRTELRSEKPYERALSIVRSEQAWFDAMMQAVYGDPDTDGRFTMPPNRDASGAKRLWLLRRLTGKPISVFRLIKAALTFENGVDYALEKLEKHSGVRLELTESQRRRPLLWSPVLLWKALKSGALH
ncbi:MAG: hypothetical protein AAF830_00560 [Pseudomonadota bacterium]